MDGKDQQSSGFTPVSSAQTAASGGDVHSPPDPEALSGMPLPTASMFTAPEQKGDSFWVRIVKRADIILAALLVLAGVGLFLVVSQNNEEEPEGLAGRFNTVNVPLEDLAGGQTVDFGDYQVLVNGTLQANGSFVLTPSEQPTDATAGQMYYDQTSNLLAYYNGTEFVPVANADGTVQSVGGLTGEVTLGNGLAVAGGQLTNTGIISIASASSNLTVTDDGAGNVTLTSTAGGGTVSSPGGTGGAIPVFTGAQTIASSILNQSGDTLTVDGDLSVSGSVTLGTPLSVANGGTGSASFAANSVLVGDGTSAVVGITGAAGECLIISGGGSPVFDTCPGGGGGGVTSLNTLTGALTIANASEAGSTITIDDATTAAKGIASFNATNFSVAGGAVNTIQGISTSASPTFVGLTLTGDVAVNGGDITSSGALNVTPGGALTVGATGQALTLQGNASTQLTATGGGFTTTVGFTGAPSGAVTYQFDRAAAAGTYQICSTVGNCAGSGGGVTTGGGTTNRLAKFSGVQTITDSTISDDGTTVTTTVDLTVQGGDVTIGTTSQAASLLLHDGNGQTTTLQAGNSAGNLTFILPTNTGSTNQCLKQSGGGNQLIWDDCDGGGGGSSATLQSAYDNSTSPEIVLDGTRGALTLRDAATPIGANLFEIQNNAGSTTYLGVTTSAATLGSNVDIVMQGATAYITNPQTQTASEAFGLNASVTGENSAALGNAATAENWSIAIGEQATAADQSVAIGRLSNAQDGVIAIGYNATSAGAAAAVAIGNNSTVSNDSTIAIGASSTAAGTAAIALGVSSSAGNIGSIAIGVESTTPNNFSIAMGAQAATTAANQLVVGGSTANSSYIQSAYFGSGVTDTTPQAFTLNGTGGSGSNIAGAALNIAAGRSTGNANGGNITLQISAPGGSGSSLNSLSTVATVSGSNGAVTLQNAANSTSAFRVLTSGGTSLLAVNTSTTDTGTYVSGTGTGGGGGRLFLGPVGDTGTWIGEKNDEDKMLLTGGNGFEFTVGSTTYLDIEFDGTSTWTLLDSTGFYAFRNSDSENILYVDGQNNRLDIGQSFVMSGAMRFYDTDSGNSVDFNYNTTPDRMELTGTNAGLFIEDRLGLGVQTLTLTDDGTANDTLTPTASYARVDANEGANVGVPDLVISETGAQDGNVLIITNNELDGSHDTFTITSSAGVISVPTGSVTLGPLDAIMLIYMNDRWVTISFSDNS